MLRLLLSDVVLALAGCSDLCANRVVRSVISPDGRHAAVLFERNCGATTGFSTQLSILRPGEAPTDGGNVFIATAGTSRPAAWGGPEVEVRWLGPDRLEVGYPGGAEIFKRAAERDGVRLVYQVRARDE